MQLQFSQIDNMNVAYNSNEVNRFAAPVAYTTLNLILVIAALFGVARRSVDSVPRRVYFAFNKPKTTRYSLIDKGQAICERHCM